MTHRLLILFFTLLTINLLSAQNYQDTITQELQAIAAKGKIPGFGVVLVSTDDILYAHGFGYADKEAQKTYTKNTVHNIGSISKTFIACVLMQLVEDGKLNLDDPINQHLPFEVVNPNFPKDPITVRQLATHTSSLTDGDDDMVIEYSYILEEKTNFTEKDLPKGYYEYYQIYNKNKSMSMGEFLKSAYTPKGKWYAASNFLEQAPGTTYHYSNIGATLLAYLIEQVGEASFAELTQKRIFEPLGMNQSTWYLEKADQEQLASLYLANGLKVPHYQLITYPDGGLITSVADFGPYLRDMIRGLNGTGTLLSPEGYKEVMGNQLIEANFPNGKFEDSKGMMWNVSPAGDNVGANGADPGVASYTLFTTQGNVGMAIFLNSSMYGNEEIEDQFYAIRGVLFEYIGKLLN